MCDYCVFSHEEGDWHVAARRAGEEIIVLFEGHAREQAYEAIFHDLEIEVPTREVDMGDGCWEPDLKDWP